MHHNVPLASQPLYGYDLYRWIVRYALDAAWDEGKHSRDAQGRFTDGLSDWRGVRNAVMGKLKSQYPKPVTVRTSNGDNVMVSYGGLKHALNKGVPNPYKNLLALHIQTLIAKSIKQKTIPDRYGRKDPASVTHYLTDVRIDDAMFAVDIVVRNHNDGNRYYDHLTATKKPTEDATESGTLRNSPARPVSGLYLSMNQLRQAVK